MTDDIRPVVGSLGIAGVAPADRAVGRVDGAVEHAQVGPDAVDRKAAVTMALGDQAIELLQSPSGDPLVARHLCGPVARDEVRPVGRTVGRVEHVQRRIRGEGIVLVRDGGVAPRRPHLGAPRMGVQRDVEVGGLQLSQGVGRLPTVGLGPDVGCGGLRLVGGHQ